jgi:hypothetical protein
MVVELITVTGVASVPPNHTLMPGTKFVPVMVTGVPPIASPLVGETAVTRYAVK